MKIRNPRILRALARLAALFVRCLLASQKFAYAHLGPDLVPTRKNLPGRYIYTFWHENMLLPLFCYRHRGVHVLVSRHADGELIAETLRHLGYEQVRGSSSRGGVEALRQMLRVGRGAHIAVTPDGPRGPRRRVQMGLVYLAARTGLPIVAVGVGLDRPWRFGSWDRFALPRPWGRARCVLGEPIRVPADCGRDRLETYRRHVEARLDEVGALAERWAEGGPAPAAAGRRRSA